MLEGSTEQIPKILVADDNEGLVTLISKRLKAAGYIVDVAYNGADTIRSVLQSSPHLILLDYRLPDMTGQEVITALIEQDRYVPFIVVTGAGDETTAVEMMKLGARDYLRKDLDFLDRIDGTIERVFTQIKIEDQLTRAQHALEESEKRFKDLVYSMDDMVYETDAQQRITYCSDQVSDVLGYSPAEMIGTNPFDFLEDEHRQQIIELASAGFADHMPIIDFEGWYIKKDGKRVCLLTSGIPVFDAQGNYCGYRGANKDITDRKMTEITLSHNDAKYRSLLINSRCGIILTDGEGTILEWNPAQENISGLKAGEVNGRKLWDVQYLLTPDDQKTPGHLSYLQNFAENLLHQGDLRPANFQSIIVIQHTTGVQRTLDTTVSALPTKNGMMLFSISYDITEIKRAEDTFRNENILLKQQVQDLLAESKRQDAWLYPASADVNGNTRNIFNPKFRASLTKIINTANTLLTGVYGSLNDEQSSAIVEIEKNGKQIITLINNMLDRSS